MRFLLLFLFSLTPLLASHIPVEFTFEEGAQTEVTFFASSGGSDSATVAYSGTRQALLHFADDGATVEGIEFTGGQTSVTDVDLEFGTRVRQGGDRFDLDVSLRTRGLQATEGSNGIGAVSPDGVLENAPHFSQVNLGTQSVSLIVRQIGAGSSEFTSFGANPQTEPFTGRHTLNALVVSETASTRFIEFTLTQEIDESDTSTIDELGISLTVAEQGTLVLKGSIELDIRPPKFTGLPFSSARPRIFFTAPLEVERATRVELISGPAEVELDEERMLLSGSRLPAGQHIVELKFSNPYGDEFVNFRINAYEELEKPQSISGRSDDFGAALAASGNWLLVGDPSRGESKVHIYSASDMQFQRTITANGNFGIALDISDELALIGAPLRNEFEGSAHVYEMSSGEELLTLQRTSAESGDDFGASVAISGNYAIVGAPGAREGKGSVYVFDVVSGQQLAQLSAEGDLYEQFGTRLAAEGSTILISDSRSVYAFDLTTFEQSATVYRFPERDPFFRPSPLSLALSEGVAYVGDQLEEEGIVFAFDTTTWEEIHQFTLSDLEDYSFFGSELSVYNNLLAISSRGTKTVDLDGIGAGPRNPGSVHFFDRETREHINTVTLRHEDFTRLGRSLAASENNFFASGFSGQTTATNQTEDVFVYELGAEVNLDTFQRTLGRLENSEVFQIGDLSQDPLSRGVQTGLAYGLGFEIEGKLSSQDLAQLPRAVQSQLGKGIRFQIDREVPEDVIFNVLRSTDLEAPLEDWTVISQKRSGFSWEGEAEVRRQSVSGLQQVDVLDDTTADEAFYRLEVHLTEDE